MHSNRQGLEHGMRPDERKKKTMKEYFAYGSNLNLGQMAGRCPESTTVQTARLEGYELAFRCGVLTILPKEGGRVDGILWKVNDREERALDRYEGYPRLYTKETLTVQTDAGPCTAVAYVMTAPYCERAQPPSSTYLRTVLLGYRVAEFDPYVVLQAAARAKEMQPQQVPRKRPENTR